MHRLLWVQYQSDITLILTLIFSVVIVTMSFKYSVMSQIREAQSWSLNGLWVTLAIAALLVACGLLCRQAIVGEVDC